MQTNVAPLIEPDSEQMRQHLGHLFERDLDGAHDGLVEIAWTESTPDAAGRYRLSHARLFDTDELDEAAEHAATVNRTPQVNVFVGAALRRPGTPRDQRTTKQAVYALPAYFADLDDPGATEAVQRLYTAAPPTLIVVTGREPYKRAQLWWDQETPERNPAVMEPQSLGLAVALGGDRGVWNCDRVTRLAGSIAWPHKPGRVIERTYIATMDARQIKRYLPGQLAKAYPPVTAALASEPAADVTNLVGQLSSDKLMRVIRAGQSWHNNMLLLTGHWVGRGWTDEEILGHAASLTLSGWTADQTRADMAKMVRGAREKWAKPNVEQPIDDGEAAAEDSKPFPATDLTGIAPARKWLVKDWVPLNTVTSLYGDGGTGKTLLAQQLAYSGSTGDLWLGLAVQKVVTLCVFCEDQRDELHRRHEAIKAAMGHQIGNPFADVHLWPRVGHDNLLVTFDAQGKPQESPFFQAVLAEVERLQAQLLVLDTAADLFGGNENDRVQVNHFVKAVVARAIRKANEAGRDMAVLVLAHPSVAGMSSKSGTSGSTAWNAAVRSRLYLTKPEDGGADERVLTRMKANYANAGDETAIPLLWKDGVLIPLKNDADAVTKIEIRRLRSEILDRIRQAADAGKPYKYDRTHPRELYRSMFEELAPAAREDVINAIKELTRDDEISKDTRRQIRGWICITD